MDDFLATFWLIGQILSVVALSAGLILSIRHRGLWEVARPSVVEATASDRDAIKNIPVEWGSLPRIVLPNGASLEALVETRNEGAEAPEHRFIALPPTHGPRPAAPA
jgi:hypothetical protein